ncbi:MAG: MBL fold metallo-hydrolase [Candidatus Diapherotrites archaeon]
MASLQYFGHSFFQLGLERNILIDPFLQSSCSSTKRLISCPVLQKNLGNVSMILISHEHPDHFDKPLIEKIASKQDTLVVAHDSVLNELRISPRQKIPIRVDSKIQLRNVNIKAYCAHHPRSFYPLSFLLEFNGMKLFHAGDTELLDELEHIKTDIALLPIGGGPEQTTELTTMDIIDAVKATKSIKPKVVIPMHYNTFETIKVDPQDFKARIEKSNLKTQVRVMAPGEKIQL